MAKKKRSKQRAEFRKNSQGRVRKSDFTREFKGGNEDDLADVINSERVSGKGALTRKRTVAGVDDPNADDSCTVADDALLPGRVISVHGLKSKVLGDDGKMYECTVRQVLKSLSIEQRNVVVAGDRVRLRAESQNDAMIERIEPRKGLISRTSRGQQHVIAANVDYLLIVMSAAQPTLKPVLIDRFLLTAEQCEVEPVLVILSLIHI